MHVYFREKSHHVADRQTKRLSKNRNRPLAEAACILFACTNENNAIPIITRLSLIAVARTRELCIRVPVCSGFAELLALGCTCTVGVYKDSTAAKLHTGRRSTGVYREKQHGLPHRFAFFFENRIPELGDDY